MEKKIFNSVLDVIGNTPLIQVNFSDRGAEIWAKLEMLNPSGSIKDRIAVFMIEKAEKKGFLRKGMTILEATTGNTGISLAMVAAVKGYKIVAVMPENMSNERVKMIKAFGGEVVLTPGKDGPLGAIEVRDSLAKRKNIYWLPNQFENRDNIRSQKMVGNEIIRQIHGKVDAFVAGVGTGGTLMGVVKVLRAANIKAKIIAVEPEESAVLSGGNQAKHNIQGIGEGFVPKLLQKDLIDGIVKVSTDQAIQMTRKLALKRGIFAGFSSGANMVAAIQTADKLGFGKKVVTVYPDRGERYLSEDVFK